MNAIIFEPSSADKIKFTFAKDAIRLKLPKGMTKTEVVDVASMATKVAKAVDGFTELTLRGKFRLGDECIILSTGSTTDEYRNYITVELKTGQIVSARVAPVLGTK